MSKDAGQSYSRMAEVCIFGGSAEGGKPFAGCQEGRPFWPGAGRQRLLGVQRAKSFGSGAG